MKGFKPIYGAWSGLLGALAFALLWSWAVVADGSWQFGVDTLSELGRIGRGGRDIFNFGVILASLLWLPFALGLMKMLPSSWLSRIGGSLFLVSAAFLFAIGIFPIDSGTPHTVASWAFFITALVSLLMLATPLYHMEGLGVIPMIASITAPILSMAFLAFTSVPLAEAIAVICLMIWAVIVSSHIILLRR